MELTLESIIGIITLVVGGSGIGAIFTWRYAKKKAKAEAAEAEAVAEKAKFEAVQAAVNATKEVQDSYQQLIADMKTDREEQRKYIEEQKQYIAELKEDRRHLRQERDELRDRVERVERNQYDLTSKVARYGRMVESLRPLLCGRENCLSRMLVTISDEGTVSPSAPSPTDPTLTGPTSPTGPTPPTSPINPIPPIEDPSPSAMHEIEPYNED